MRIIEELAELVAMTGLVIIVPIYFGFMFTIGQAVALDVIKDSDPVEKFVLKVKDICNEEVKIDEVK
tara:strand:+ start:686 stop:886 length:201 start_codon:yes stop_codon:yes gene_type:complete